MASFDLVYIAAVVLAVGGLAAVLLEILAKNPRSLVEMATDSRRFAEAPVMADAVPAPIRSVERAKPANVNRPRLAA